jgi:hypothetical protein
MKYEALALVTWAPRASALLGSVGRLRQRRPSCLNS